MAEIRSGSGAVTEKFRLCQRKYVLSKWQRPRAVDNPFQEAASDGLLSQRLTKWIG